MFTKAGQPEILRNSQRDDTFQRQLNDLVSDLIRDGLGVRTWIKYREVSRILTSALYQVLTTLSNLQTLGEEYTGLVQIGLTGKSLPSKQMQILMIVLNTCGEKILIDFLKQLEKYLQNLPDDHPMRPEARIQLINASMTLRESLPFLHRVHRTIFYLHGNYYHISKRLTGIRYILVRYWLKDRSSISTFRLLGIISSIHLILLSAFSLMNFKKIFLRSEEELNISKERSIEAGSSHEKCALCLNLRQNTTATTCGHLFCWSCIIPWLQEQPLCPLCRQPVQPSRVVPLKNY